MRPWKAVLGVGAACAACCAVPLLGGAAVLAAGTATLAGLGSALLACADEFAPLAIALLGLAAMGAGVILWRRRAQRAADLASSCSSRCNANSSLAHHAAGGIHTGALRLFDRFKPSARQAAVRKPCGCAPGGRA